MVNDPWLGIIGIAEDGLESLTAASRDALRAAEFVFGGPRHLRLAQTGLRGVAWPIPFSINPVLALRGRNVVVLVSGDPFWFGAGSILAEALPATEWRAWPAPSAFAFAAARQGWRLEETSCLGLHAAPFETLMRHLSPGRQLICLVRDGAAAATLAEWLVRQGFGASMLWVMEALGGTHERVRQVRAAEFALLDVRSPVAVAILAAGAGGLSRAGGLPDEAFTHDGQITKRPVRAITLSALAPKTGELLWDVGAGSGSLSVEWCLAGGRAIAIEPRPDRVKTIRTNANAFGISDKITLIEGRALDVVDGLDMPDAIFIGGGASCELLDRLWSLMPVGARLVANAVTLETEALVLAQHKERGGELMRIELSKAMPLGELRGWVYSRPLVQWSVIK